MPGMSRRAEDDSQPYRKRIGKVSGVRKVKDIVYNGWRISLQHRDQGVQLQRIAYSARVTEIGTKTSFYVPPADSQKLVIKNAKIQVDRRIERAQKEKPKYLTVEKVLNLWFREEDDQTMTPPVVDSPPLPE
ncbi:MAG: hypothetical protein JNL67_15375 [Planctomycetaceae bacterium]|nr:hypothetical protein [Planctomycetaceae bacterium]